MWTTAARAQAARSSGMTLRGMFVHGPERGATQQPERPLDLRVGMGGILIVHPLPWAHPESHPNGSARSCRMVWEAAALALASLASGQRVGGVDRVSC